MPLEQLTILLPCHSLDDFPVYHTGDDAHGLLSNWTALWHPRLIGEAGSLPTWKRVDDPPDQCRGRLILVPSIALKELPTGFARRAEEEGGCLITGGNDRDKIAAQALEFLEPGATVDRELVLDFFALGYCYLQIQLLTRQMRYSSNLDQVYFQKQVVAAAGQALAGDPEAAREKLGACFDVLAEERDHFYPVDAFLIDLTLLAPGLLEDGFIDRLESSGPTNLLLEGPVLEAIVAGFPQMIPELARATAEQRLEIVGGEMREYRLPLLPRESILAALRIGLAEFESRLGLRPKVFARRRFGMSPVLPRILLQTGFTGALHATLDDGRFPEAMHIRSRWEGTDDAVIDAFAKVPVDASKPETFLNLAIKMGEAMDMDHVATTCFAHWSGRHSVWYEDLRRIARFSGALGKFVTLSDFLRQAQDPGHNDRFSADQYRSPYLVQAVSANQVDPLSRLSRYWNRIARIRAAQTLSFVVACLEGEVPKFDADRLMAESTAACEGAAGDESGLAECPLEECGRRVADCLSRDARKAAAGFLVLNPSSFVRRMTLTLEGMTGLPAIARPVYGADVSGEKTHVVVDVPSLGFAWIPAGGSTGAPGRKRPTRLAEDYVLRNEYCELVVDQVTGGIRSIQEYQSRNNRLSQQLAFRQRRPSGNEKDEASAYTRMLADSVKVTESNTACGQIESRGRLLDAKKQVVAEYEQRLTIWRGSRVIELDLQLATRREPDSQPWESYYCSRFAWKDDAADIWRSVNEMRTPVVNSRFEAPEYFEIAGEKSRTTILTNGLAFHRRQGMHVLDTLLICRGDRQRSFKMGIGIDVAYPRQAVEALATPPIVIYDQAGPPAASDTGWLFHLDAKNVVATHWRAGPDGAAHGFAVRLLESMGRPAHLTIQALRPILSARRVDFLGQPIEDCQIQDGNVIVEMQANDYAEIEAAW